MIDQFIEDVLKGLSSSPKSLPSKYFYDKKGDELFIKIMNLPEYYLTRSELEIFQKQTEQLADQITMDEFDLVELGAGDGTKSFYLLEYLFKSKELTYIPIDISLNALSGLKKKFESRFQGRSINIVHAEYFQGLNEMSTRKSGKVIMFLGSNLGNMSDDEAAIFLVKLSKLMKQSDLLILGLDLIKSADIVLPAYNDSDGVTSQFNLNLLNRINHELDGDFKLDNFVHVASYSKEEGVARSFLKSLSDQTVTIKSMDKKFHFRKDELIQMEISRKYDQGILEKLLKGTELNIKKILFDSNNYFANFIIAKG